MSQHRLMTWQIRCFPVAIKNKFMGLAKMQGKKPRELLANILRRWIYEQEERSQSGRPEQ